MVTTRSRFAILATSLALTAALAAPAMAQEEPVPFEEAPYIPIVSKGFQHQFWQAVKQGAEDKGAELNASVNFIGPPSESDVAIQIEMLQAEYDKGPAAICFAALDSQAANPLLEQMAADGIPVIAFDSGVDSDIPITTAATDNVAAAALAADKMAELIGGSGQVGVIVHDQTSRTGIDRSEGFVNRMAEAYPDIEIIGPQYGNEGSAIGVVNAVNELDMAGDIVVIGYDSGIAQIDAIRSGVMAGAVQQNPIGIGAQCVRAAAMALQGLEVPPTIDTGFIWADLSNIDSPEVQAVLYE